MTTHAIIPCKSKSERLPNKNRMRVGGRTLTERAVWAAQGCDLAVVCSDDPGIIEEAQAMARMIGVEAVGLLLPEDLVGKRTHLEGVIDEVAKAYPADRYVMLQPTSPLRKLRHVASALTILHRCDSVLSVHEVTKEVYFAGTIDEDGRWTPDRPKGERVFTNDLEKVVCENGAIYAWTHDCWLRYHDRSGGDCRAVEMDSDDAIDIDTPAELERAQRRFGGEVT